MPRSLAYDPRTRPIGTRSRPKRRSAAKDWRLGRRTGLHRSAPQFPTTGNEKGTRLNPKRFRTLGTTGRGWTGNRAGYKGIPGLSSRRISEMCGKLRTVDRSGGVG